MDRAQRFLSAMKLSKLNRTTLGLAVGVSQQAISDIIAGKYDAPDTVERISKRLAVPFEWLVVGDNPPSWAAAPRSSGSAETHNDSLHLPLIGQVTAGDGWANPSQDPDDSAPVVIKGRWRAVRIEGSSAEPIVLPGQCVLVDDQLKPKHGRLVCVQTNDGRAYCKRFCDVGDGHIVLAGLNAGQDSIALHRDDIARISVVVGTLYTDSVAK